MAIGLADAQQSLPTVSRNGLMAGLLILASVNGLAPPAIESVIHGGWQSAVFDTFKISVIVWGAWAAACYLAISAGGDDRIRSLDVAIAGLVVVLVALPLVRLSWLGLFLLAAYVFWTSSSGSRQRRSAVIFLAICVPMLWGPVLFALAASPLLNIDAYLVALLVGTRESGNVVTFVDGINRMQIWPACSSFHNISQAGLAWVALRQVLNKDLAREDMLWAGLAVLTAAAINLARLSLMAISPAYFALVHGPVGAQIAGGLTILSIAVLCTIGQRRELFAQA
jgi:hypothetical protein